MRARTTVVGLAAAGAGAAAVALLTSAGPTAPPAPEATHHAAAAARGGFDARAALAPAAPSPAPARKVDALPREEPPPQAVRVPMDAGPTGVTHGHRRLWVTRDDGSVARLEPRTGRLLGRTRVGRFPVRLAVRGNAAWVVDDATGGLTELEARHGRLRRTIRVCDLPSGVAATDTAVWVVCATGQLVRVDASTGRVTARTRPGPPAADPADLIATRRAVWVAGRDRVMRVDSTTGAVTATVTVSSPADVAAGAGAVWVANFDEDTVTRIDPARAVVTGSFRVGRNPSGIALAGGRVWVLNNGDSTVTELGARSGRTLATIPVGAHSYDIAAGGGAVWAQSYGAQALFRIRLHAARRARPAVRYDPGAA